MFVVTLKTLALGGAAAVGAGGALRVTLSLLGHAQTFSWKQNVDTINQDYDDTRIHYDFIKSTAVYVSSSVGFPVEV